ncbi:MAG: cytochrome-c peroxidase [Fimbriimonadaceae bacterium]
MRALIGFMGAATILALTIAAPYQKDQFAKDGLPAPDLNTSYDYENLNLPQHYKTDAVKKEDNIPANNPITNAGATLGRVLFYDKRLSKNNTIACASCHIQSRNFSDETRDSKGFNGGRTGLNAMALTNVRYYESGHVFWTERDKSIERQAVRPIVDPVEMGTDDYEVLAEKLKATGFYPDLFNRAFGTPEITRDRIGLALSQFERTLISTTSKFDKALEASKIEDVLTKEELLGYALFGGPTKEMLERNNLKDIPTMACNDCHQTAAFVLSGGKTNNGINGGRGKFKVPSLRNIEVSGPYMHDGRFSTLLQVLEHYMDGINDGPDTDNRLRINNDPNQQFERFRRSTEEQNALIAFLKSLTDHKYLSDPKYGDPFNWPKSEPK